MKNATISADGSAGIDLSPETIPQNVMERRTPIRVSAAAMQPQASLWPVEWINLTANTAAKNWVVIEANNRYRFIYKG